MDNQKVAPTSNRHHSLEKQCEIVVISNGVWMLTLIRYWFEGNILGILGTILFVLIMFLSVTQTRLGTGLPIYWPRKPIRLRLIIRFGSKKTLVS